VFERPEAGMRDVPRDTVKITIEMPGSYRGVEMPRDLLVQDDAELARIALEERKSDEESSGLSDLDDSDSELSELDEEMSENNDESDSELSELDDKMFEGWLTQAENMPLERQKEQNAQEADQKDDDDSDSELSELDDEMLEGPEMEFLHARWPTREEKAEMVRQKEEDSNESDSDLSELDEKEQGGGGDDRA
jgi:hypothetical protein